MDAATNRASEGFRVIEDICRFSLEDVFLSESLKQARHDLVQLVEKLLPTDFRNRRNTPGDIGQSIQLESEYRRNARDDTEAPDHEPELIPLVRANFCRVQQAIRTLEEFGKLSFDQFRRY